MLTFSGLDLDLDFKGTFMSQGESYGESFPKTRPSFKNWPRLDQHCFKPQPMQHIKTLKLHKGKIISHKFVGHKKQHL
jgi:hypothetical protein